MTDHLEPLRELLRSAYDPCECMTDTPSGDRYVHADDLARVIEEMENAQPSVFGIPVVVEQHGHCSTCGTPIHPDHVHFCPKPEDA